jgi:hypothetical protein
LGVAGRRFEEHLAPLDLDATGGPVEWATGSDPAPVWLDVAREYMERYVHQQQIRDATGRPIVRTTVDGALRLYVRDPSAPPLTWQGDHELAEALAEVKAVLG